MTAHRLDHFVPATSPTDGRSNGTGPDVITALICDTPLLRSGLRRVLSGTPFVVAEERLLTDPGPRNETAQEPALCILAVGQRSSRTPEMTRQIKDRHPAARIVVLADHFEMNFVTKARAAGVDGFCLTGSSREVLTTSLELVMLGESMLPGALVGSILDGVASNPEPEPQKTSPVQVQPSASRPTNLSVREKEILGSLMNGAPNKIIARKLDVAEATVKVHVKAILRKIGVANRTQAAMWAMSHLPSAEEASLRG
jgi:two-component system nitrate/nitrite response regulator NarL